MADITANIVKELRDLTGLGMMECKKALIETSGNIKEAEDLLRIKSGSKANRAANRIAAEGTIGIEIASDRKSGALVEVNCETDFVAKNNDFVNLANETIEAVFSSQPASVDELLDKNSGLKEKVIEVLGKVGEKVEISRIADEETPNGILVDYIHMGSKLGVLIKFDNVTESADEIYLLGKDVAMQVAAMNPLSVYREDIPKETIEKEIEIYKEVARKEGKSEQILEKIAIGKLNKFYQENCLAEQSYIKDNSKTVGDLIKEFNINYSSEVKIALFHRFHLGDENK